MATWELPSIVGAEDEDDPTVIRFVPAKRDTRPELAKAPQTPRAPQTPPPLSASRVAVMKDPHTGRPTLMVLPPGVAAPRGSAVAMLVASSSSDNMRLGELLEHFVLEQS